MPGCSQVAKALLSGGGPNVAANTQAGKTNSQTVGETSLTEQKITNSSAGKIVQTSDKTKVKADSAETITINELPVWLVGVFLALLIAWSYLLWKLPSPDQIWKKKEK